MSRDLLYSKVRVLKAQYAGAALTASKTDLPVIDRRDYASGAEPTVGFIITLPAVATADGTNYMDFEIFEADEKTSATALTSGTKVDDDDVLGPVKDDVAPAPSAFANQIRVNDTALAGSTYFLVYRGYKNCIQLRVTETLTASVQPVIQVVIATGETVNTKAPVVS